MECSSDEDDGNEDEYDLKDSFVDVNNYSHDGRNYKKLQKQFFIFKILI
jgi:hypothetical protein